MNLKKNDNFHDCVNAMHRFAEIYAKQTNTFFCFDPSITSVVITGLATYKDKYGVPLCPCRNYNNKEAEVELNYWVCPCVSMRERKECHCKLFINPDDEYASENQKVDINLISNNL